MGEIGIQVRGCWCGLIACRGTTVQDNQTCQLRHGALAVILLAGGIIRNKSATLTVTRQEYIVIAGLLRNQADDVIHVACIGLKVPICHEAKVGLGEGLPLGLVSRTSYLAWGPGNG